MSEPEPPLSHAAFVAQLRDEGARRYHDHHPFHIAMHAGSLSREQLQAWTLNRYYYQTRIPIKDALILAKSDDPEFRRRWIERIQEQDGAGSGDQGGLAMWLRLGAATGLDPDDVASCWNVLPGVPNAKEAGLPDLVVITWNGVVAPAGMPAALVARLHTDIVRVSNTQDMKERMAVQAAEVFTTSPEEFAAILRKDFAKWLKVVKDSGARAN